MNEILLHYIETRTLPIGVLWIIIIRTWDYRDMIKMTAQGIL